MRMIVDNDPRVYALYHGQSPESDVVVDELNSIGVESDGQFLGGWLFDRCTGSSVHLHPCGVKGWLQRDILYAAFQYVFIQLGCKVAFAGFPEVDEPLAKMAQRLGFVDYLRIDDVYPSGAQRLMRMYQQDCIWLERD